MSIINIKNLVHRFVERDEEGNIVDEKTAIDNLDLDVKMGQFIAILGHNGSGKSTLAKHINALLMPTEGDVLVDGDNTKDDEKIWDIRQKAGMVFQNPDNQIIATIVEEDVGFGPENMGVETKEIWERVEKALNDVGMIEYRKHSPNRLSGGQKQRVAIAGVMAMKPKCILLDEPTAMLDPNGRKEVIEAVTKLNKTEHVTIILVTHYMDEVVNADKVFVMDKGKIVLQGTPREIFSDVETLKNIRLDVPQPTEVANILTKNGRDMKKGLLTVNEFCDEFCERYKENYVFNNELTFSHEGKSNKDLNTDVIMKITGLTHIYAQGTTYERKAVNDVSFEINRGEILGVIGHTGSGKSTLIQHLNGLIKANSGEIEFEGKNINEFEKISEYRKNIGLVFQFPEYQLFESTVIKDVCYGPMNMGMSKDEAMVAAKEAMELVGLGEEFYERTPFELSGGEKRRVAIAGVIAMGPKVLILDEPTAGLDPKGRDKILNLVKKLREKTGMTIIIVSHSMEDMGKYADRILVMENGRLKYIDSTTNIFSRYKELEGMGLAAPQVLYLQNELRNRGIETGDIALTPGELARKLDINIC